MRYYFKKLKNYYRGLIILGICTYGLYLRVEMRTSKLWVDELWQLGNMHLSFIDFVKSMPQVEHSGYIALDFYLIYPFFKLFAYNKWGLAIPHILSTIIGFYLLYLICKLYCRTIWGYVITFSIVCLNANLIIHSFEIRSYAILPTLALAAFLLSQKLIEENFSMNTKKKWAIGAFFVLVIWSFSYGILMLAMILFFFLLNKRRDVNFNTIFKNTSKLLFFVLLVAMPLWIYSIFFAHLSYHGGRDVFQFIPNPLEDSIGFLKGIFGNLVGCKKLYFLLIGLFFPLVLRYKERFKQLGFLLILVAIPIELLLIGAMRAQYWFIQRHFVWVMPLFALFLGWSWDSLICYMQDKFISARNKI